MESYLDQWGPSGRQMMCSTAAIQITIDGGLTDNELAARWQLVHDLGPMLVAMFANSPYRACRATGWKSTRQAIWWAIDPTRTMPAYQATSCRSAADVTELYVRYALKAPVMLVKHTQRDWSAPVGLTFGEWVDAGRRSAGLRPPTTDDLAYHLTTLFPPVRARGAFEVRYIDAQPADDWIVPTVVLCTLLNNARAADTARDAVEPVADAWESAARSGLDDPALARAAVACMQSVLSILDANGLASTVNDFSERYTERRRCPADDRLDRGASPVHKTQAASHGQESISDEMPR
jgi:glutamate--cysteine ligase